MYGDSLMGIGVLDAMMAAASSTGRKVGSSTGRRKAQATTSVGEADERGTGSTFPFSSVWRGL
jgi:hypothetical protein